MEMEKICIELPIVRVETISPIFSSDFAKEHYEVGMFILDDGIARHMMHYDGTYVNAFACPHEVIEKFIVERAVIDNDEIYHRDMEAIEDRLAQIARLVGETKDEVRKSETRIMDELSSKRDAEAHEFTLIMEGMNGLHDAMPKSCGGGVNILDVAKSYAVIQKPELIKELSK